MEWTAMGEYTFFKTGHKIRSDEDETARNFSRCRFVAGIDRQINLAVDSGTHL